MKAVRLCVCCMLLAALTATAGPGAAVAAEGQGGKDDIGAQVERLVRQLGSDDFRQRDDASRKLFDLGPVAIPQLREALKDSDKEVASRARGCITELTRSFELTYLTEVLGCKTLDDYLRVGKDPRPHVRASAVYWLHQFRDDKEKVIPILVEAAHDEDAVVRCRAVSALGLFGGDKRAVAALIEALKDPGMPSFPPQCVIGVAAQAASCLEVMRPPARAAVPALIEVIQSDPAKQGHRGSPFLAFRALGSIAARDETVRPTVLSALAAALRDKDLERRNFAGCALGVMGAAAGPAVPDLLEAFQVKDVTDLKLAENIRGSVLCALWEIGPEAKAAVPFLVSVLQDKKLGYDARERAAKTLEKIGRDAAAAIPALTDALEDQEPQVCQAAAKALRAIRQP